MLIFKAFADLSTFMLMSLMIYHAAVVALSYLRRDKIPAADRQHSFALVISARNERDVLPHLIETLDAQDYPRELFDVFVIADNCTDDTAEVCEALGAKVYRRDDLNRIGKGHALKWFFDRFLPDYGDRYEIIGIFDADNLVDKGYLAAMNRRLCSGEAAVMGNRDSKNPGDNWVAGCSSLVFWTLSTLYFAPRAKCGLSAMASGTGFVFRTELIKDGWKTTTLCEDTEFTMELVSKGMRVTYEPKALFYDEQPTDFLTSVRQRRRWGVGGYQNIPLAFNRFAGAIPNVRPRVMFDALLYILAIPLAVFNFVCLCAFGASIVLFPTGLWPVLVKSLFGIMLGSSVSVFAQGFLTLFLAKKINFRNIKSLFLYPFFLATTSLIYVTCLFTPNLKWHPVRHKRAIDLRQMN